MTRTGLRAFLFIIMCVDAIMVATLMGATVSPLAGLSTGAALLLTPMAALPSTTLLLAPLTGWSAVARRFPAQPRRAKPAAMLSSIAFNSTWKRYNNCIEWCADDEHLHLTMALPFAKGHPDISIPWGEAEITEQKGGTYRIDADGFALFVPEVMVKKELALRASIDAGLGAPAGA